MSSELLNTILYKKIPSFASIHINSITFQKCHYLFLMTLLEKSDNSFKIINFDPLFYRFFLSYKNASKKYNISSDFDFFSTGEGIGDVFSSINKNNSSVLIVGLNLVNEKEKISEFFYNLNNIKYTLNITKIIFVSFQSNSFINDLNPPIRIKKLDNDENYFAFASTTALSYRLFKKGIDIELSVHYLLKCFDKSGYSGKNNLDF